MAESAVSTSIVLPPAGRRRRRRRQCVRSRSSRRSLILKDDASYLWSLQVTFKLRPSWAIAHVQKTMSYAHNYSQQGRFIVRRIFVSSRRNSARIVPQSTQRKRCRIQTNPIDEQNKKANGLKDICKRINLNLLHSPPNNTQI